MEFALRQTGVHQLGQHAPTRLILWVALLTIFLLAPSCGCGPDDVTTGFGPDCGEAEIVTTAGGGSSVGIAGSSGIVLLSDAGAASIREIVGITNADSALATAPALTGNITRLSRPQYLALQTATNDLVVADQGTAAILFFNDPTNAEGNTPPGRILVGPATELVSPVQAYVETTADELYVLDRGSNMVLVYPMASTIDGDVAPVRRIGGANSGINSPASFLFRESSGQMVVINPNEILTFETFTTASGDPAPVGRVGGGGTTFSNLVFAVIDSAGGLIAVDSGTSSILYFESFQFDQSGVAPTRTIVGGNTGIVTPGQFSLTTGGDLYLANGTEVLFFQSVTTLEGNVFPNRRFSAVGPTLQSLRGLLIP